MDRNAFWIEVLLLVGISQAIFSSLLVLAKKEKSIADKILAAWLILMAIEFLTLIIDLNWIGKPLLSSSFLLVNPAFYFYVKSLTQKCFKLKPIYMLHLVPFVFFEVSAYIVQETIMMTDFFREDTTFGFRIFFGVTNLISLFSYNLSSIFMLHRHRHEVYNEFSSIDVNRNLAWVFFIVVFYSVYWLSLIIISLFSIAFAELRFFPLLINYSVMLLLIYVLGFYGLGQKIVSLQNGTDNEGKKEKYANSTLTDVQKQLIKSTILDFFEKNKPYLDADFNMDSFSERTGIPKHQLTEVLSTEMQQNFFSFVNKHRIEAVKKMLVDPENLYSIEAIAYDCGFNSKSAFYSVFKKQEGCTPNYWKELNH
ncbi:MAG TPA: hypothetical protein DCQ58_06280 [Saprospirales bacterium]|nr:hypothetical protein [Saprospirales bacterium]